MEKGDIHLLQWHSTSTSEGIHYRRHFYVEEASVFLPGRISRWEIKVTISLAPARLFLSHYFIFHFANMMGYRIRDNELQFCYESISDRISSSNGEVFRLPSATMSKKNLPLKIIKLRTSRGYEEDRTRFVSGSQ